MAKLVKHSFHSPKADGTTPDMLEPSHWNADHIITGVVESVVAGTNVTVDNTDPANPIISAIGGSGSGDVVGPASAVADDIALFNGVTGKLIKDSGAKLSDLAPVYHNHQAGIDGTPTITEGTGTFTIASGTAWFFTDATRDTMVAHTIAASGTMTPTDNQTGYVCADRDTNTWVILADETLIDYLRYVPYFIVFKRSGSNNLHTQVIALEAHGEVEAHHQRISLAEKYARESGLDQIAVDVSLNLTCNTGVVWAVNNRYTGLNITAATRQFKVDRLGNATSSLNPVIDNLNYDNGSGFVALAAGEWVTNWIFKGVENQNHCYTLLSNKFASAEEAKANSIIGIVPELISSHAILIGRVIVEQNQQVSAANIESAFTESFNAVTSITAHNDLTGLQGGTTNEYYHVPAQIYSNLTSGAYQATSATSNITTNAYPSSGTTQFAGVNFAGTNVTGTMGTNGLSLSVASPGGGGNTVTVSGSNGSIQSNGISFLGSNGINVYTTTGNQIVVSGPTVGGAQTGISTIAGGGTTFTAGGVTIVGSGNVAITNNAGNLVVSAPVQSIQTQNSVLINGNSGAFTLAGTTTAATNAGLTVNSNGVNVSVAAQSVQTNNLIQAVSGTNSTGGSSNFAGSGVVFPQANGMSFIVSGNTVSGSVVTNYSTGYSAKAESTHSHVIQTTTIAGSTVAITNASAGATIAMPPFITTYAAQTVDTNKAGISTGSQSTAGANIALTLNTNGLNLGIPAYITTYAAQSADTNKVGIGNVSTVSTAGVNMTGSAGTNGITLAVPAWQTAGGGGATSGAYYVTQNSTGGSSSGTYALSSLNIIGAGIASVGNSGNSLVISVPSGGGAGDGVNIVQAGSVGTTGTTWSSISATVGINGSGAITVSQNNSNQLVINAPAMSVLSAVTNCTLGTTGNTIGISVGAGGAGVTPALQGSNGSFSYSTATFGSSNNIHFYTTNGSMVASYADPDAINILGNTAGASSSIALTNGSMYLQGGNNITLSQNGSTVIVSAGNAGGGANLDRWWNPAIGLNQVTVSGQTNASASIQQMLLPVGIQFSRIDVPMNFSGATTTLNNVAAFRFSNALVIYTRTGDTLNPIAGVSNTQSWAWSSNATASIWGSKYLTFGLATTLAANEYWVGLHMSSASAISSASGTNATTALGVSASVFLNSIHTTYFLADMGNTTNVSYNGLMQGLISSAITNTAQTLQVSQISQTGANLGRAVVPMRFRNV